MIRLLRAEAARLAARRFSLVALVAVLLAIGAFQLVVNHEVSPPSAAERAAGEQAYAQEHQAWEDSRDEILRSCQDSGLPPEECVLPEPQLSDFLRTVDFAAIGSISVSIAVYLSGLVGFLAMASFIGAEFSTGAITNWLSFVPRRGSVYAAKLIVAATASALLSALTGFLALGVAVLLARVHGTPTTGLDRLAGLAGRGIGVAVALAVVGFVVGLLTRHTAAAVGVLLGYLFVTFVRGAVLAEFAWAQRLTPWVPDANLAAVLEKGHRYVIPVRTVSEEGTGVDYLDRTISLGHGLAYWGVLLLVVTAVGWLVFRRRDVV